MKKIVLSFGLMFLSLSLLSNSYKKEDFVGVFHMKSPYHDLLVQQCFKNPSCLEQKRETNSLGIVFNFNDDAFLGYSDENLVKKELGLLEGEYEPKRKLDASGQWRVEGSKLILEGLEQGKKVSATLDIVSVEAQKFKISVEDNGQKIEVLFERLAK